FDQFCAYIRGSRGEFSVCKNAFVATRSGWVGDRIGAYLACGRPVVMQDTGFGERLPCGEGLFAVRDLDEAVDAIERIEADPERHRSAARAIAETHFEAETVLESMLTELGIRSPGRTYGEPRRRSPVRCSSARSASCPTRASPRTTCTTCAASRSSVTRCTTSSVRTRLASTTTRPRAR